MKIKEPILDALIPISGIAFLVGWMMASSRLFDLKSDYAAKATIGFVLCLVGFAVFLVTVIFKVRGARKEEIEAKKAARFFNKIIEAMPIGIFVKDVSDNFRWIFINHRMEEITKLTAKEYIGKTDDELFPKEQAEFFREMDLKAIAANDSLTVSVEQITSKEQNWLARVIKTPVLGDDGSPVAILGVAEDITEQQRNEEKLREFEAIITSMNDGVIISTPEQPSNPGRIVFANEAFTRITGYSTEEVIGKSPRILLSGLGSQANIIADRIKAALRANQVFMGEIPNKHKDGGECWVSLSTFPINDANGKVKHFVFIERDITQNKLREEELRRARLLRERQHELLLQKEKAEVANQAKSEFLANMSHELRTPLNSIMGMTRLLTDTELNNEQHDIAAVVLHSSAHLLDIVNDILDLSKIEAREVKLEKIGFDMSVILNDVTTTLQPLAVNKNILLVKDFAYRKFPYVLGDPMRLSRVLTNLLGNAIKYTDEGCVQIKALADPIDDKTINFTCKIVDTGIGIPAEKLEAVFDKFVQADTSTTRRYGGTGLGLAITKQLVELMGGKIGVTSRVGQGSTFWFTIPFEVTNEINIQLDPNRRRTLRGEITVDKAKVLIAEDHPMNQILMKKLMKSFGIVNFKVVENGQKTLDAYKAEKWDLILMDVHMPVLNGFEATAAIRALGKISGERVPIVALTANAMTGDREKCLRYDMDDYISKPVSIEGIKEVLGQWILFDAPQDEGGKASMVDEVLSESFLGAGKEGGVVRGERDISSIDIAELLAEAPVNLDHLHSFTGGDEPADRELINVFVDQSDINIQTLEDNVVDGENMVWSESAHMLKGGAGAIGANHLASLCASAQKQFVASSEERRALLDKIKKEYQVVKDHLKKIGLLQGS